MNPLIGALVLILLGLLGARLSFTTARAPLGPRLIFSAGTHFLFLGYLLGSHGLGLLGRGIIDQLYPFLALGLGWIGLLFGLQLDRRQLRRFPPSFLAVALGQAVIAFGLFLAVGALIVGTLSALTPTLRAALLAISATACVSTPAGIALISNTFLVRGKVSQILLFIASLDAVVGILALQLTYALYHPAGLQGALFHFGPQAWVLAALALGALFGVIFLWFTRPKPARDELTLLLLGLVVFASGAALYLGLSPLFLTMITGAVVANVSPLRRQAYALLQSWEQPIYVILLVLAGALLDVSTWLIVPFALGYLVVRAAAKLVSGFLVTRFVRPRFPIPAALGLGLVPQGGISLAMAISITLTYGGLQLDHLGVVELVFGTVVFGVVASELIGPLLTRDLLREAGEIHPRVDSALAGTRGRTSAGSGTSSGHQPRGPFPGRSTP